MKFQPAIPTRGSKVPARPEWLHEVKDDGFRLLVHRDASRVRLLTRNGFDWSGRYPRIAEAALKNRTKQFVIDGEVVVLGVNGARILRRYTPTSAMTRRNCMPLTCWRWMERICARCLSASVRPA
jgi:ATP-dependent DNA ligase